MSEDQVDAIGQAVRYAINKIGKDKIKSGEFFGMGQRK